MNRARDLFELRRATSSFKRMVLNHIGESWRFSGVAYGESEIVQELPKCISKYLVKQLSGKGSMPLFLGLRSSTMVTIASCLRPVIFNMPTHIVYRRLGASGSMYFISQGDVELRDIKGKTRKCTLWQPRGGTSVNESLFGEESLFHDVWPCRHETATCLTSKASLMELTVEVPCFFLDFFLSRLTRYLIASMKYFCVGLCARAFRYFCMFACGCMYVHVCIRVHICSK